MSTKLKLIDSEFENNAKVGISTEGLDKTTYICSYLMPNIDEEGNNILLQEHLSLANHKYVVRYNFDLNGATITVPAGCIIEFDGGSFFNGSLVGNDTKIVNLYDYTIMTNINASGSFKTIKGVVTNGLNL